MTRFLSRFLLCTSILLLAACSGTSRNQQQVGILLPALETNDPSDEQMHTTVKGLLAESGAPLASMYDFQRYDLDGDGRRDALVMLKSPYGYWCGIHGCTVLVLHADNETFSLVNAMQPVREPIYVNNTETNGWKDITVRVSGRVDKRTRNVAMRFNGRSYPENPEAAPSTHRYAAQGHDYRVFYE